MSESYIEAYKIYGLQNKKIKTFSTEKEMQAFMKKHNLIWQDLVTFKINDCEETSTLDIRILQETEHGMIYSLEFEIVLDRDEETGIWHFWWTENYMHMSPRFRKINDVLKDYIQTKQKEYYEDYDGEENTRYSIYDVYSERELL